MIFFITVVSAVLAASPTHTEALFNKHFSEKYEARFCGRNILRFLKEVRRPEDFYVVKIKNKGASVFGMVNAEQARGEHFRKPATVEINWHDHVIALDNKGLVYDFDYTTTPQIIPMPDYLELMFLDEPECTDKKQGGFCAGRDSKLKDYTLESLPASNVLAGTKGAPKEATLGEVLEDWEVLVD